MDKGLFNFLEELQYEARPVIYAALAFYAFWNKQNPVLFYSGIILAVCCVYVLKKRYFGKPVFNIR